MSQCYQDCPDIRGSVFHRISDPPSQRFSVLYLGTLLTEQVRGPEAVPVEWTPGSQRGELMVLVHGPCAKVPSL